MIFLKSGGCGGKWPVYQPVDVESFFGTEQEQQLLLCILPEGKPDCFLSREEEPVRKKALRGIKPCVQLPNKIKFLKNNK